MLRIRVVGELRVDLDGRALPPIVSRRARSLPAWLAYHPGVHPRTRVASVFWPDVLEDSARGSLTTTLARLRRELGETAAGTWSRAARRPASPTAPAFGSTCASSTALSTPAVARRS